MTLKSEILAGGFDLAHRNDGAIAAALSVGRTKLVPTEIGTGTVLETLGVAAANQLLDAIYNTPDFRYVKPLLEQGRLRIDSAMVRATLDSLVPAAITQINADKLKAVAVVPDVITPQQVAQALEGM